MDGRIDIAVHSMKVRKPELQLASDTWLSDIDFVSKGFPTAYTSSFSCDFATVGAADQPQYLRSHHSSDSRADACIIDMKFQIVFS